MQAKIQQFIQFGLVGALNTVLTTLIYWGLYRWLGPTIAMAIGYGLTSVLGLALNGRWVFRGGRKLAQAAPRYYLTYAGTWALSVGLTAWWSNWQPDLTAFAPIVSLCATVPVNFILSRYWVFNYKGDGKTTCVKSNN